MTAKMSQREQELARRDAIITAQESKIRELEFALASCSAIGVRLHKALVYIRDSEPDHDEVVTLTTEAMDNAGKDE